MAFKVLHDEVGDAESDSEVQHIDQHDDWMGGDGVEPGEAWSTMDAAIAERESRPTATGVDPRPWPRSRQLVLSLYSLILPRQRAVIYDYSW